MFQKHLKPVNLIWISFSKMALVRSNGFWKLPEFTPNIPPNHFLKNQFYQIRHRCFYKFHVSNIFETRQLIWYSSSKMALGSDDHWKSLKLPKFTPNILPNHSLTNIIRFSIASSRNSTFCENIWCINWFDIHFQRWRRGPTTTDNRSTWPNQIDSKWFSNSFGDNNFR